jgi:hypothetical protein
VRKLTPQEREHWSALFAEHGRGTFVVHKPERVVFEQIGGSDASAIEVVIRLVTPLGADDYEEKIETLAPKLSPILFDRTADGSIVIPERWCQRWFEILYGSNPWLMANAVRRGHFCDCVLPTSTDTVEVIREDANGAPVSWEALPPGTLLTVRVRLPAGDEPA